MWGRYKKYPSPEKIRGGIQISIPRFHPGYGNTPSLIGTITGAPGAAFLPHGSEVVSFSAGVRMPCTKMAASLGILPERMSSSQLFSTKFNTVLTESQGKTSKFGYHNACSSVSGKLLILLPFPSEKMAFRRRLRTVFSILRQNVPLSVLINIQKKVIILSVSCDKT